MRRNNAIYIILVIGIIVGLVVVYIRTPEGGYHFARLKLKLPLVGRVSRLNQLARCCRNIALLFKAGLPLTEILPLTIQSSGNRAMTAALNAVQQGMLKGEGLSQPMSENPLFYPMMVQMVKVGEETGSLDSTLLAVAESYETEAQDKTRALIGIIQPAMTLGIAAIVGVIALSLVSAMYSIYGQGI